MRSDAFVDYILCEMVILVLSVSFDTWLHEWR